MGLISNGKQLPRLPSGIDFTGKAILITGASSGIGYEFARQCMLRNASILYLAVRDALKMQKARDALLADLEIRKFGSETVLKIFELDLLQYASVMSFSVNFNATVPRLDIAMLNAGMGMCVFTKLDDLPRNEYNLQVNYLSNAMLSLYLLPILRRSARSGRPSHLTFVGSHEGRKTSWDLEPMRKFWPQPNILTSLNAEKAYKFRERFRMSKMFVEVWTRELIRRVSSETVIVNCVCPGFSRSSIDRDLPPLLGPLFRGARVLFARPTAKAADTYLIACTGDKSSHGEFFSDGKAHGRTYFARSIEGAKMQNWIGIETVRQLQLQDPVIPLPGAFVAGPVKYDFVNCEFEPMKRA